MPTKDGLGGRLRIARLTIAIGTVAALGVSAVALAGPSKRISGTPVPSHGFGTAVARCAKGTGVIATGFDAPGFNGGDSSATVARVNSRRAGPRSVRTRAFNFGGADGSIKSLAYCSKAGLDVRVRARKVTVDGEAVGTAVASCRRGSQAIGGGFAVPHFSASGNGVPLITLTSRRAGARRWKIQAVNAGDGNQQPPPGQLVAFVYCLRGLDPLVTASAKRTLPSRGVTKSFSAKCPPGTRALSGGFDGQIRFTDKSRGASAAVGSRRAGHGRAWRVTALSIADSPAPGTAYAYCLPTG